MNHASMSEFYETSNRIFSNPEIFQAKLQLPRSRLDLEPSKIAWTNITHLTMGDAVEFSNFLLLITALPRAVKLDIAEITLQNHPYEMLNETEDFIKPFESRIEDLRMYVNTEMYPTPLPAIEYVVLRIHSLRRVRLSKDAVLPARVIAKLLEPNYPHLVELVIDNAY
ncbi:hypothetical protein LPJ73_003647 [Coemansia sp. RSA 2703]|nr:hypothetical protein LPJ73_003647 [Coemansia sp. RSA 2703]KAJ2369798.1 hypothetical protein IW150_005068 [Coemansia sp. RSA 2607]